MRYAVVAGDGARSWARVDAETEPPDDEYDGIDVGVGVFTTGQSRVVNVASDEVAVPTVLTAYAA